MSDQIRLRSGHRAGMPVLADREPAYVRDEEALYVGTPAGNVKLCAAGTEGRVGALETLAQTHKAAIASHGETLTAHTAELERHIGRLTALETGQSGNGNRLTALESARQTHGATLTDHGERLTGLEATLRTQGETLTALGRDKLTAAPARTVTPPTADADVSAVAAACAALIAALQEAGLMQA